MRLAAPAAPAAALLLLVLLAHARVRVSGTDGARGLAAKLEALSP